MSYVDGVVCVVADGDKERYRDYATNIGKVFKEYGATQVVDCWGDEVPDGKLTSFPMAVKRKENETVVFSWIWWPSKQVRDEAWLRVMKDPRCDPKSNPMPLDGQRMIYGGFEVLSEVS